MNLPLRQLVIGNHHGSVFPAWRLFFLFIITAGIVNALFNPSSHHVIGGDLARFATCESLVERGTFIIDESTGIHTVDKVYIGGHFYGCQTPLMPLLMALVYYPFHLAGLNFASHKPLLIWIITLIFAGGSAAGTSILVGKTFHNILNDAKKATTYSLIFFFGTFYFSYSGMLSNHLFSGFLIYLAFYLIIFGGGKLKMLIAGLAAASAVVTDPPAGIAFGLGLFIFMIQRKEKAASLVFFIAGGLVPGIIHSIANIQISGDVFPVNINPEFFKYPGAIFDETNLSGVVANTTFSEISVYAFHCLLGYRGLFIYTPILIFALWGIFAGFKNKKQRPLALLLLLPAALVIAFYIWRTQNYGGYSYGVRFFIPVIPPLFTGLVFITGRLRPKMPRLLFRTAVVCSVIFALAGTVQPASNEKLGWNSFASNIFHYQSLHFPGLSKYSWRIMAGLNGYDHEVLSFMGEWFFTYRNYQEALSVLNIAHAQKKTGRTHKTLGRINFEQGRYDAARDHFHASLSMDADPGIYKLLGRLYYRSAGFDSSSFYFQRFLAAGDSAEAGAPEPLLKANNVFFRKDERNTILTRLAINSFILGDDEQAESFFEQIS
ncbi:MAG: tetratricopeptide repeat protein, partial [FCB group bacterium]|nr:tetratricopeptide repeat protein [FCB group bacterium]